jgi:hypothetical protein
LECFQDLKLKKKYKYILYKLDDDYKSIIIEKTVEEASYDDFVSDLTSSGPRYAVYDFDYEKPGEGQRSKIAFYSWYVFIFILSSVIFLLCESSESSSIVMFLLLEFMENFNNLLIMLRAETI